MLVALACVNSPDSSPHSCGAPCPENIRCVQFRLNAANVFARLSRWSPQVEPSHEVIVSHMIPTVAGQ